MLLITSLAFLGSLILFLILLLILIILVLFLILIIPFSFSGCASFTQQAQPLSFHLTISFYYFAFLYTNIISISYPYFGFINPPDTLSYIQYIHLHQLFPLLFLIIFNITHILVPQNFSILFGHPFFFTH